MNETLILHGRSNNQPDNDESKGLFDLYIRARLEKKLEHNSFIKNTVVEQNLVVKYIFHRMFLGLSFLVVYRKRNGHIDIAYVLIFSSVCFVYTFLEKHFLPYKFYLVFSRLHIRWHVFTPARILHKWHVKMRKVS